jgi:histidinol-phosphate aminotransferase
VPYEPGKPVEELQRELGLENIVKLASNEGSWGPLPAALEAIQRSARELNRYPDGGAFRLRAALAERHGVRFEEIAPGAGADGVMDCVAQTLLDPGDEIVCGWPSFSSYVIDAQKMGAKTRLVPLRDHRYDLHAMLGAVGPRTKIVYICYPNNPTGTASNRAELDAYFASVPDHVLTVIDQAYFEYVEDPDYADTVETYFKGGCNVLVVHAIGKVRRAFDMSTTSQEAALASLDDAAEIQRRRQATIEARAELSSILTRHGLEPVGPAVGNFLYADIGQDATALFESLLREGVIVRPLAGFGAPEAVRITVGTAEDHAVLDRALSAVVGGGARR